MLPAFSGAPAKSYWSAKTKSNILSVSDQAGINVISAIQQVLIQIYEGRIRISVYTYIYKIQLKENRQEQRTVRTSQPYGE